MEHLGLNEIWLLESAPRYSGNKVPTKLCFFAFLCGLSVTDSFFSSFKLGFSVLTDRKTDKKRGKRQTDSGA